MNVHETMFQRLEQNIPSYVDASEIKSESRLSKMNGIYVPVPERRAEKREKSSHKLGIFTPPR